MLNPLDLNNPEHLQLTYRILLERYLPGSTANTPYKTPGETFWSRATPPTYDEHTRHLASGDYDHMYLWDNKAFLYIKKNNEIGIYVLREHTGQGIGPKAMQAVMDLHPRSLFACVIHPDNMAAKKCDAKLGFRPAYEVWVREQHASTDHPGLVPE